LRDTHRGRLVFASWLLLLTTLASSSCVPSRGGWDPAVLEAVAPPDSLPRGHRLKDTPPHLVPSGDDLLLVLCRWDLARPLRVSLPPDAREQEFDLLRRALRAWQDAIPRLGFVEVVDDVPDIEIRFAEASLAVQMPSGTANTIGDCAIPRERSLAPIGADVAAALHWASIHLRRTNSDAIGRRIPLDAEALLGTILHELGHALGFAGHVALGSSIMSASPETVRGVAASLMKGEPFHDASVAALYAVPSGFVVGSLPVSSEGADLVQRLNALAGAAGFTGPFSRVGGDSARLLWRRAESGSPALTVSDWPDVVASGRAPGLHPNAAAVRLLAR
jgi:hypothetical protein